VLKGEARVALRRDTVTKTQAPAPKALVSEEDAPLLAALKAKRRALAEAAGVPAYIVFNDRTLIAMAERRPRTLDEMAAIPGVGAKKLESYGDAFLEVIAGEAQELHPSRRRLAGRPAGALFDRLMEAQQRLARGETGIEKPMSCTASTLRHIAERRPGDLDALARIPGMGAQKTERFGPAFLDVLSAAD
jgi:ATP-dependent DNA helicase RecQ